MAISQLSVPFSWGGKGQPYVGVTGGAQVPWVGTRGLNGHALGVPNSPGLQTSV